jgi:FAD:protein FMN transferase
VVAVVAIAVVEAAALVVAVRSNSLHRHRRQRQRHGRSLPAIPTAHIRKPYFDGMQQIEFHAMGCQMHAMVDTDDPNAQTALAAIPRRFEAWEQCLSRFRESSELVALNRRSGETVRASETLWQVTRRALQAAAQTDGLVTPTVLDALEAAGYARSMSEPAGALSTLASAPVSVLPAPRVHDWRVVKLEARRRTITLPRGVRLDLAGVAKGWAAEQAARQLARVAPALVEASGDIAVSGPRADGSNWPIGVAHPFGQEEDLPLLLLAHEGVATSTRGYRRWLRGDKWQHHLIDPRTGLPAETDVFSATAIAPTATQAEAAAKVALILGSRAGIKWIEARADLAALLILENGAVLQSSRLEQYVWG